MYVFGWTQGPTSGTSRAIIEAFIKRGDYNVLVLDWSAYTVDLYTVVMLKMSKLSRIMGRVFVKLFRKGLNDRTFHCVGHSFGKWLKVQAIHY
jgi:predicted alpha/beta-fold hydrolase